MTREITIRSALSGCRGRGRDCEQVAMQCVISDSVPKRQTRVYSAQVKHGGKAAFNDESLDDFARGTFGFDGATHD